MAVRTRGTPEETARRGSEIFERDVRPAIGDDQQGRFVSIDIDSGAWAIADTRRAAVDELYAQHLDACDVWTLRVGYRAAVHLGGRPLRSLE